MYATKRLKNRDAPLCVLTDKKTSSMTRKKITIAIDGYSSSGKSTMARELARRIGYVYVDSGAMYRAVTLYALRHGMIAPDGAIDSRRLADSLPEISIKFSAPEDRTSVV